MIRFVLDNNAAQDIVVSGKYDDVLSVIVDSIANGSNSIYCTHLGYLELVTGLNEENFAVRRDAVEACLKLCNDKVLDLPETYILHDLGVWDSSKVREMENKLRSHMRDFCRAKLVADLNGTWTNTIREFKGALVQAQDNRTDAQGLSREITSIAQKEGRVPYRSDRAHFREDVPSAVFLSVSARENVDVTLFDRFKELDAILYYADYWYRYNHKTINGGMKSRRGDAVDSILIMYLDRCDYLVTNDGSFRDTVNDPENDELFGRAISVEQFMDHVLEPNLSRRAPVDGYDLE